jgi:hypothetical protein
MPATNRLSRVAKWQNAPLNLSDFAAVRWSLMALSGQTNYTGFCRLLD